MLRKQINLFILLIITACLVNGQNAKVQSAIIYLNEGLLDKAKENIDPATTHIKTMNNAKTFYYRGFIYLQIYFSQIEAYKNLDANALDKAYDAFQKCIEIDSESKHKEYVAKCYPSLRDCAIGYFQEGRDLYFAKEYEKSLKRCEKAIKVRGIVGETDTLSIFVAAASAEAINNYDLAKKYFERVLALNLKEPAVYRSLYNIYMIIDKDEEKAYEVISKGRELFPDDINIIKSEISYYLQTGKIDEARKNLDIAIEKEPNNHVLYFAQGTIFDTLGLYKEAVKAYQKSLEIQPDYFEATFNLGAAHFNKAIEIIKRIEALPLDDPGYDTGKAEADELMAKALPYFEKALELSANDYNSLIALKEIYARTKQYDKLKEVNAKLAESNKSE
ncbi:tetratricopeptide repeat protein [Bacteroidota bacterium]